MNELPDVADGTGLVGVGPGVGVAAGAAVDVEGVGVAPPVSGEEVHPVNSMPAANNPAAAESVTLKGVLIRTSY